MEASFTNDRSGGPGPPRRWQRRRRGLLALVTALALLAAVGMAPHAPGEADGETLEDTPVEVASVLNGVAGESGAGPGAREASAAAGSGAPSESPPGTGQAVFRSAVVILGVIIVATVIFVRLRRLRGRL